MNLKRKWEESNFHLLPSSGGCGPDFVDSWTKPRVGGALWGAHTHLALGTGDVSCNAEMGSGLLCLGWTVFWKIVRKLSRSGRVQKRVHKSHQ